MRKIITLFAILLIALPVFAGPLEGGITFDWVAKTQIQRDESIKQVKGIVFENAIIKYPKAEFKKQFAPYYKDENFLQNYAEIVNGKQFDETRKYCGFFIRDKILYAYGIQYNNNPQVIYYYNALGKLSWIDKAAGNYPNFPYIYYQYKTNGQLSAAYYYISADIQYAYTPNKEFKGIWYKDKLYNKNAKVVMTRSNY